jgi:hypothetical protein
VRSQDQAAIPGASLELCDDAETVSYVQNFVTTWSGGIDGLHVSIVGLHVMTRSPCEASTVSHVSGDRLYEGVPPRCVKVSMRCMRSLHYLIALSRHDVARRSEYICYTQMVRRLL